MILDKFNRALSELSIESSATPFFARAPNDSDVALFATDRLVRFASAISFIGLDQINLDGKEPFARADIVETLEEISSIKTVRRLSITTDGWALANHELALKLKGVRLDRIAIKTPALDEKRYRIETGADRWRDFQRGLRAAREICANVAISAEISPKRSIDDFLALAEKAIEMKINLELIAPDSTSSALEFYDQLEARLDSDQARKIARRSARLECASCSRLWLRCDGRLDLCPELNDSAIDLNPIFDENPDGSELGEFCAKIGLNKPMPDISGATGCRPG